jgi:predicted small lipoprotein YifL
MLLNRLVRWMIVLVCWGSLSGCAKKSTPPAAKQEPTKTAAEYKAEADKQIDEKNASQELDKLEQSIDEEASQTQ